MEFARTVWLMFFTITGSLYLLCNVLIFPARSDNVLVGYINSKMIYIENNKTWEIVDLDNNTLAFTNDTDELPVGLHSWYFLDVPCTDPGVLSRKLNLHQAVKQPGNFCCDNGACIRTV